MTNRDIIKALMPTLSERPDCYYRLAEKLIAEGFVYHALETEWVKGAIKGRMCHNGKEAWLRDRYTGAQSHNTV